VTNRDGYREMRRAAAFTAPNLFAEGKVSA
jgi:hypothetical protein